jgi:hypothetical protein
MGSMSVLRVIDDPQPALCGADADAFLRNLGGPACLRLPGRDRSRSRALVTLLHGNEPSGVMALRRWILQAEQPAVDTLVIVASVHAALEQPAFSHRMLPRARDLNRCFRPPFDDEQGRLAAAIIDQLSAAMPESVVDMHNTSGSGPAFALCTHLDPQHDALASLFSRRLIVTQLKLGALMDLSEARRPTITVEVGGRQDEEAHAVAFDGMCRYFRAQEVLSEAAEHDWGLEVLHDPIRIELREGVSFTYAQSPQPGYDITLTPDIEHFNFGIVSESMRLGWVNGDPRTLFRAIDAGGRCAVSSLLQVQGQSLRPAQPLKLFMITTNAVIAQSDCLCYAVIDDGRPVHSAA